MYVFTLIKISQIMVKVYYESSSHAELVATFETEELYNKCLPILEIDARKHRMVVTESIT
jgi:hypothetical protein